MKQAVTFLQTCHSHLFPKDLNHYAVRTMNNDIPDFRKEKHGAHQLEKNKSVANTYAEESSTL